MTKLPGRRERKKDRTRQALLEVAGRLIAERGVHGTRVEDITERSDLGKGAFYNYFESKAALIAELVAQGIDLLHHDYLPREPAPSQVERIAAIVAAHDRFFEDHPAYVALFHQARGLTTIKGGGHEHLAAVFLEYLRRTGAAMTSPEQRELLDDAALVDVAAILLGAIAGYRSFRIASGLALTGSGVSEALLSGIPAAIAAHARDPS